VALHRPDYIRAPKIQKPSVARVIVRAIRNGDPPGRFIRKDEATGKWVDVGDKKAAEKTYVLLCVCVCVCVLVTLFGFCTSLT
jgi:hypothetical protein